MISLPNLNYSYEMMPSRSESLYLKEGSTSLMDERANLAIDLIKAQGTVNRMELETLWGISRSTAGLWLDQMVNSGVLLRVGHGRNTRYTMPD